MEDGVAGEVPLGADHEQGHDQGQPAHERHGELGLSHRVTT